MKYFRLLVAGLLAVTTIGCVSRPDVSKKEPLRRLIGKTMVQLEPFFVAPIYSGSRKSERLKGVPVFPDGDPKLYIRPGTQFKLMAFEKLPDYQGGFIVAVVAMEVNGSQRLVEFELLPDSDNPGKNEFERAYIHLKDPNNTKRRMRD